jgi:hypothetical protein
MSKETRSAGAKATSKPPPLPYSAAPVMPGKVRGGTPIWNNDDDVKLTPSMTAPLARRGGISSKVTTAWAQLVKPAANKTKQAWLNFFCMTATPMIEDAKGVVRP